MDLVQSWQSGGTWFDWRGQRIFVRECGAGEALLLIHGFPTSSLDWHRVEAGLAARFRVISLDLLGFGLSSKPLPFDYRIATQADLCEAVLAQLRVDRCRVLAHDYGDSVAQELLARQNEGSSRWQLQQLCMLNGGLFPETHRPRLIQRLLASPLGPLVVRLTTRARFAASMQQICRQALGETELDAMWALIEHHQGRRVMPQLIGYMAERRRQRERWVGALQQARVPLRLVDGLDDPISGAHMVARYRALVARADVVELAGVGHYPQLEAPDAVVAAVLAFAGA